MSTTTVGDLLDRADYQARALRHVTDPTDATIWEAFEATTARLLRELVGPLRTTGAEERRAHAALTRLLDDFPHRAAAPATTNEPAPTTADVPAADPTSTDPLAQLAVTLGALADLLSGARDRDLACRTACDLDRMLDHTQTTPVIAHLLAITTVAGRHAMNHLRLADVDRPLAVARYAEHALDTLADPGAHSALTELPSFAPPQRPAGPNQELEADLRTWATSARAELARTIPSTEVLRNITNSAVHLYAATDQLLATTSPKKRLLPDDVAAARTGLRDAAGAMRRVEPLWAAVTTGTRPSHDYVNSTTRLYKTLNAITHPAPALPGPGSSPANLDVQQALTDLHYAAADVADLLHIAAALPDILARSQVLYAPARILPGTIERLHARQHGHWIALLPSEVDELHEHAMTAASAAMEMPLRLANATATPTPRWPGRLLLSMPLSSEPAESRDTPSPA